MPALGPALRPNQWVSRTTYLSIAAGWAVAVLLLWLVGPGFFPTPGRVLHTLRDGSAELRHVSLTAPSLEDVYLHLTGHGLRE